MPTVAAIGTVVGAGVSVAGAAGAFNPGAPDPLNYGQITRDAQQAQIDLLPAKYAASAAYDPKFAATQSQINWNNLFGTKAGTQTVNNPVNGFRNTQTGEFVAGTTPPTWTPPKGHSGPNPFQQQASQQQNPWVPFTQNTAQTVNTPASPGSLATLSAALPQINQLAAQANTTARAATISDVQNLGPQALAALKAYDPQSTQLADTLASQAANELNAGTSLTPSEQRDAEQNVRAGQSARGLGYGPTDVFTEAMNLGAVGQQRLQQRQAFAGNVINQRSQMYGDPFLAIAGTQSGRNTNPGQFSTAGASPTLADIQAGSAPYSIAGINQGYNAAANIAGYNSQMSNIGALLGSGPSSIGSLGGSLGSIFGNGTSGGGGVMSMNYPTSGGGRGQ